MQRYCTELTERLLKSLDKEYNVVDMGAVVDVITALEKTTITKEVLENTRLGKYINELRRKTTNDALAKRAKDLVRRWRNMVLPSAQSQPQPTPADTAPPALNGAKPHSPALRCFKPHSPALKSVPPRSPLLRDTNPLRVLSPVLSVHSDHSHSPNASSTKQSITVGSNHRTGSDVPPTLGSSSQQHRHSTEAVPRTHSSNKRLRKDEPGKDQQSSYHQQRHVDSGSITESEPFFKKQRLNGENISGNLNMQVPSPAIKERISDQFAESSTDPDDSGPKKRGRKKGSKSAKKQPVLEDRVKEKLASISRNPKLKTTQELLADLRARGTSATNSSALPSQSAESPSIEDVALRGSGEKLNRCSQNNLSSRRTGGGGETTRESPESRLKPPAGVDNCHDPPSSKREESGVYRDKPVAGVDEKSQPEPSPSLTVEEILAKLPPIDPSAIDWSSECDTTEAAAGEELDGEHRPREPAPEDIERLHAQCVEGLNGNYQPKLSSLTTVPAADDRRQEDAATEPVGVKNVYNRPDQEFREWHQMLARPSYDDQILHILPYVIID